MHLQRRLAGEEAVAGVRDEKAHWEGRELSECGEEDHEGHRLLVVVERCLRRCEMGARGIRMVGVGGEGL